MADIDLTWGKQIPPGTIFKYRDMGDGTHAEVVAADAVLDASDIEIGAVEIKNSTDDTRATVGANGLYVEVRAQPLPAGGTLVVGSLSATTSGQALGSQACKGVLVQNDPDNTVDILAGDPTTQNLQLAPGGTAWYPVSNANLVYVKTVSATATVPWQAIV